MRFSIKRNLKFFVYFSVVLFVLSLIREHSRYYEKKKLAELQQLVEPITRKHFLVHPYREIGEENADAAESAKDKPEIAKPHVNPPKHDPAKPEAQTELNQFFTEREKIYRNRQNQIQEVCNRLGKNGTYGSTSEIPLKRFRWLNKCGLIMCFNAKVGTSSWTQYLMEAAHPGLLKNTSHWHYTAERLLKPPSRRGSSNALELMNQYTKVILVRDPFARIVSAYLDKIARMRFGSLCRVIVKQYRKKGSGITQRQPTFEEFVRFLVDNTPTNDDIRVKRNHRTDRHWFHYYANCAPCNIHYDIIATMESVHEDTRYIMERLQLGIKDKVWNNHQAKSSSEEKAIQLFQDIPRNLTLALYRRYQVDFQMFGYGIEKYLPP